MLVCGEEFRAKVSAVATRAARRRRARRSCDRLEAFIVHDEVSADAALLFEETVPKLRIRDFLHELLEESATFIITVVVAGFFNDGTFAGSDAKRSCAVILLMISLLY